MPLDSRAVGILAGHGEYPSLLARRLAHKGHVVVIAGLAGQFDPGTLVAAGEAFIIRHFPLGALRRQAAFFLQNKALECYFAGGVHWKGAWRHVSLDRFSARSLVGCLWRGDDRILRSVAAQFGRLGVSVADPAAHIGDLFLPPGVHVGSLDHQDLAGDVTLGWRTAKEHGARDHGQGVVVHRGRVAGVESRGGTDALLVSAPGPGAVFVKVVKPRQDRRFDLPAIGPRTVHLAAAVGVRAIVVEAGSVMVFQKETVIELAAQKGVALVAVEDDCGLPRSLISHKKGTP